MRQLSALTFAACLVALPVLAQPQDDPVDVGEPAGEAAVPPDDHAEPDEDDESIDRLEPDFTLVNLPTGLNVPRRKGAFRVTHRFARPLGRGDFGELLENFFGLDGGAQIGLEYRFGLARGTQIGIYRTSDRTIQLFGQYQLRRGGEDDPLGLALLAAAEGLNNFREEYSPSLGLVASYRFGSRGVVYAEPLWVGNTRHGTTDNGGHDGTLLVGLAARVSVRDTVYLVVEVAPRVAGHTPGNEHASFAIEKVVGGHVFQLNFSNGIGSTRGQLARGATDDWFIGFNISRKLW